jgi:hypothetical protein
MLPKKLPVSFFFGWWPLLESLNLLKIVIQTEYSRKKLFSVCFSFDLSSNVENFSRINKELRNAQKILFKELKYFWFIWPQAVLSTNGSIPSQPFFVLKNLLKISLKKIESILQLFTQVMVLPFVANFIIFNCK